MRFIPSNRPMLLVGLASLLLILPQCTDKQSADYVKEGLAHIEAQDFDAAEHSFNRAIEKDVKNPEAHYGLGGIYNYRRQYKEAEKSFKATLKLDPTHIDAHYSLGYTYEQMGNTEAAQKEFSIFKRQKKKMDRYLAMEKDKR